MSMETDETPALDNIIFGEIQVLLSEKRTALSSLRTGIALPSWTSEVTSASAGNSIRKSSPTLHRSETLSWEVRWRLPSLFTSVARMSEIRRV